MQLKRTKNADDTRGEANKRPGATGSTARAWSAKCNRRASDSRGAKEKRQAPTVSRQCGYRTTTATEGVTHTHGHRNNQTRQQTGRPGSCGNGSSKSAHPLPPQPQTCLRHSSQAARHLFRNCARREPFGRVRNRLDHQRARNPSDRAGSRSRLSSSITCTAVLPRLRGPVAASIARPSFFSDIDCPHFCYGLYSCLRLSGKGWGLFCLIGIRR